MKTRFIARIASRLGWLLPLIASFFCPGCDSPPTFGGIGSNDDHRTSPGPASPARSNESKE